MQYNVGTTGTGSPPLVNLLNYKRFSSEPPIAFSGTD
jgi:hypothetical protein